MERLEEIGSYYYSASIVAKNLRSIWEARGNYWDTIENIVLDGVKMEGDT